MRTNSMGPPHKPDTAACVGGGGAAERVNFRVRTEMNDAKLAPTMGSLFDGIGGFPLAAIHNGIVPVWASEIEAFPIEVTRLRFPDMVHVGDITKLDGAELPPVDIIRPEQLFDGDVFLFCASRMVPDTSVTGGDVRMAQYGLNRELAAVYARMAREKRYQGLFCVVSDPVDPLCRAVLRESNRDGSGRSDGRGLRPCQVRGFGLGVMHARALYFARREPRFAAYLTEGRAFGPHGEDLVLANSVTHYDDALSRALTEKVAHANLDMRRLGYKPYVAPALSSGALTLLALLRGQWHYASVYMDGIFMGCRQRLTPAGIEVEQLSLPPALRARIEETAARLRAID